jgi:hypothetical protein
MHPPHAPQEDTLYLTSDLGPSTSREVPSTALLRPPSCESSPWWEERTQNLLGTTRSLDEIIHICRFDLFSDPGASAQALCRQPDFRLDGFLVALGDRHISDSRSRKAEKIVRILRGQPPPSPYPELDVSWLFRAMASSMDVSSIAEKLDCSFCSIFCRTTYYAWTRWILGYRDDGISGYLSAAFTLRNNIFQLLYSAPLAILQRWRSLLVVGLCDSVLVGY